jgi:uncharacterized membrane protein YphA (DoxX/SURF4 family)
LLLRGAVGIAILAEGGLYLAGRADSATVSCAAIMSVVAGGALVVGILTPLASLLTGLLALAIGFSFLPAPVSNIFDARLSASLFAMVTAAIVFIGPGAFSLDARLFGRRQIIIPRRNEQ